MKQLQRILINTLVASFTTSFIWFALTFWVYLETRSVIANAIIGACFPLFSAVFGIYFGTYIDHHKKKSALLLSGNLSLVGFVLAGVIYFFSRDLLSLTNPFMWLFILLLMFGSVAANLRMIALSTLVTILVPEKDHGKANGRVGMVNGLSFTLTSIFSGLAIAYIGMGWSIVIAVTLLSAAQLHLVRLKFKDKIATEHTDGPPKKFDFAGSLAAIRAVPGLSQLIVFSMINNLLFGVYMALLDPYGLEMVSVQVWGTIFAVLSGFMIISSIIISTKGTGKQPLKVLFMANILVWITCIIMPLKESILLLTGTMLVFMMLMPLIEAAEQTALQKIVPLSRQGRVFGFAQTAENLVSPLVTVGIGPLAHFIFIPYMREDGRGAELIGSWFGTGLNRGIGLLFVVAGVIGLVVSIVAFQSPAYRLVNAEYNKK